MILVTVIVVSKVNLQIFLFLDVSGLPGVRRGPQSKNLRMYLLSSKTPLSKSLSMPDMDNRIKKRERLLA